MNLSMQMTRGVTFTTIIVFGFFATPAFAKNSALVSRTISATEENPIEFSSQTDVLLGGAYNEFFQQNMSEYIDTTEAYSIVGSTLRWQKESWRLQARPELRVLASPGVGLLANDPAYSSIRPPKLKLPMRLKLTQEGSKNLESYLSLETLFLDYQGEANSIYLGRKVVSLGVLQAIPIWNKWSRPGATSSGLQALIYSQDSIGSRHRLGEWTFQTLGLFGNEEASSVDQRGASFIGEAVWNPEWVEAHFLAGKWWKRNTAGVAVVKDVNRLTLRTEALFIESREDRTVWDTQAGIGGEGAWTEKLSTLVEVFYQTFGATSADDYTFKVEDPFQILQASAYAYIRFGWKWTDTLTFSPSTLVNLIDSSQFLTAKWEYAWSEQLDISLNLSGALGPEETEFSQKAIVIPQVGELGVPLIGSLEFRWVF
jgi:hypothetical protein